MGAARKYTIYAIGEIALVVIGILIALQINNWNEWRKARSLEKVVFNGLIETCNKNHEMLVKGIETMKDCNISSQIILSFLNDSIPYSDTLSYHFNKAQWPNILLFRGLEYSGYEGLKNRGFEIIENVQLRQEVIVLFEKTIPQLSNFAEFLVSDMFVDDFIRRNFRVDEGRKHFPIDPDKISRDNYFHSIVRNRFSARKELIRRTNLCVPEIAKVLQLIKNELGEEELKK